MPFELKAIESETGTNIEDIETNEAGKDKIWTEEPIDEDNPNIVGPLYVPLVENTSPQEYQWHFTHFPIYRTGDVEGWKQINPTDFRGKINNPERFIWCYDLRICGAFYATVEDGIVNALRGAFELADVGSVLEWEDGSRDEIIEYISISQVRISGNDYYEGASFPLRACMIGNGRVMRASQVGNIITRTHGSSFTSADLRKTVHWSTGGRSYITEILDANRALAHESMARAVQGLALDPTYRFYNDAINDDQLSARETTLLLKQRGWLPMPNCNIGVLPPGFMAVAIRNSNVVYYGQLTQNYEYFAGFYNAALQLTKVIKEDIQMMWVFPDKFVVWTSGKTYHTPTNQPQMVILPKTGDAIAVLPGTEVLDPDKGLFDWGSIQDVGNGTIRLYTSEPGFVGEREFNGTSYSENLAYNSSFAMGKMSKDINNIYPATCSIYNGISGYLAWGKEKVDA